MTGWSTSSRLAATGCGSRAGLIIWPWTRGCHADVIAELDARANRLARFLVRRGVRPGDRIGLLFDGAVDGYVGMLAVLKVHAAYVPLDAGFPADRLTFIAADAGVRLVLTHSRLAGSAAAAGRGGRAAVR